MYCPRVTQSTPAVLMSKSRQTRFETLQSLSDLCIGFAKAEHNRRLCDEIGSSLLGVRKGTQGLSVCSPPVSNYRGQFFDSLDIVRIDVQAGIDDQSNAIEATSKITGKTLDEDPRILFKQHADCHGKVAGTTVRQVY